MISVYLHIPYCMQKCRYCDFCSVPLDHTAEQYCDALIAELAQKKAQYPNEKAHTVFFGGGTPTVLPAEQLCRVLRAVDEAFPLLPDAEVSIECNPKTASREGLRLLRQAGFNRLSIGLQTHDDALLKRIGRVHSFSDFQDTLRWAREAGFSNINVDVMHGLPGQTEDSYLETLRTVIACEVEHISAYALILEEDTPLFEAVASGEEVLPEVDAVADMEDAGFLLLEQNGYHRYEVSNFAREGRKCRHNLTYWRNEPYLGIGVAAHGSMPGKTAWERMANTERISTYYKKLQKGQSPETERITVNTFEQMFETIMLGLRLTEGIFEQRFSSRFGCTIRETYPEAIAYGKRYGWWDESDPETVRLNGVGMDHLDAVLRAFRERNYWELLR